MWYVYKGLRVCWPVRPEKTCSEERRSYVRRTKREAWRVTIDSYIQAGICDCDVLFVLARDKCTDLVVILIICFVFNKLLFIYIYCWVPSFSVRWFIHINSHNRNWLAVVRDTKFLCTFTLYCKTIEFDFCEFLWKLLWTQLWIVQYEY